MSTAPGISLPRFEGPLDLLLALVHKNEIDIADIPIAEITRQYLDYLHRAEELNLDLGSEFVYMAALLIHIKSKCLLPRDPVAAERGEDPREELARRLLEHEQVRQGAEFLKQKLEVAGATWSRSPGGEFQQPAEDRQMETGALNLLQVLRLAQQALSAARTYDLIMPAGSVDDAAMIQWLDRRIAACSQLEAGPLLAEQPDAPHRMALFLAMLEMAKLRKICLEQRDCFGPISIALNSGKNQSI